MLVEMKTTILDDLVKRYKHFFLEIGNTFDFALIGVVFV